MIPLNALSIPSMFHSFTFPCLQSLVLTLYVAVSQVALGKEIWNVHPDDVTQFLYVSSFERLVVAKLTCLTALLLGRTPLPRSSTGDQDFHFALLSQDLPPQRDQNWLLGPYRAQRGILHYF